jgi:hypothetical protein
VLSGEIADTDFIIFGFVRPGLKPTIHYTPVKHVDHPWTAVSVSQLLEKPK